MSRYLILNFVGNTHWSMTNFFHLAVAHFRGLRGRPGSSGFFVCFWFLGDWFLFTAMRFEIGFYADQECFLLGNSC